MKLIIRLFRHPKVRVINNGPTAITVFPHYHHEDGVLGLGVTTDRVASATSRRLNPGDTLEVFRREA